MRTHILPILKRIRQERGDEVLLNPERLKSFLLDMLRNEYPGEIGIVVMLLEMFLERGGVRRLQREQLSAGEIDTYADYVSKRYYFHKTQISRALKCWNEVLHTVEPREGPEEEEQEDEWLLEAEEKESPTARPREEELTEFERLMKRAEAGDAAAQFELGEKYRSGVSLAQDFAKALHWYKEAAGQGNAEAHTILA